MLVLTEKLRQTPPGRSLSYSTRKRYDRHLKRSSYRRKEKKVQPRLFLLTLLSDLQRIKLDFCSNFLAVSEKMSPRSGPLAPGVAFITGGARGLGNAIAVSFAKEGARGVAIVDIQDEETLAAGRKAVEAEGTKACPISRNIIPV